MPCLREGTVALPDGRRLGYAEYGVRDGTPVLHFHGLPGGRFYDMAGRALVASGAWMFTLERPGIGLSDPKPGRTLLDWPRDVAAFADAMGINRFSALGTSAGAPYALAAGHVLADRVAAVGLQCGFCPLVHDPSLDDLIDEEWRDEIQRYRVQPEQVLAEQRQRLEERAHRWASDPRGLFEEIFGGAADGDREAYVQSRAFWMRILAATYGHVPDTDEYRIQREPWGFSLEELTVLSMRGMATPTNLRRWLWYGW